MIFSSTKSKYYFFKHELKFKIIAVSLLLAILIIFLIFVSNQFNKPKDFKWNNAKAYLSLSLLNEVINDKPQIKPDNLKFIPLSKDIYLFDFNSPEFCGIAGCIYSLYDAIGRSRLEIVADSSLPPQSKFKFIDIKQNTSNKFPCIIFSQADWIEPKISHTEFCYVESKFRPVNQTFSNF